MKKADMPRIIHESTSFSKHIMTTALSEGLIDAIELPTPPEPVSEKKTDSDSTVDETDSNADSK